DALRLPALQIDSHARIIRVLFEVSLRAGPIDDAVADAGLDAAELSAGEAGEELLHRVGQRGDSSQLQGVEPARRPARGAAAESQHALLAEPAVGEQGRTADAAESVVRH